MKKGINCGYCVNYLESLVIKQGCQLIDIKNRGGLVIPANNVVTIVKLADGIIDYNSSVDGILKSFVKKEKILCQKDIIKKIEVGVKTLSLLYVYFSKESTMLINICIDYVTRKRPCMYKETIYI